MSRKEFSHELASTEPDSQWDRDLALLSSAVYRDDDRQGELPGGWGLVKPENYPPNLVPDESHVKSRSDAVLNDPSKFRACIYKHNSGERYAVVFRGTKTMGPKKAGSFGAFLDSARNDAAVNIGQSLGLETTQYELAMKVAQRAKAHWGNKVIFAGHSLGGGLAAAASIKTGNTSVTFNPAGIHENTIDRASRFEDDARRDAQGGMVRAVIVDGDGLDRLQKTAFLRLPTSPGVETHLRHERLEPTWENAKTLHSLEATISAMDSDAEDRFSKDSVQLLAALARSQSRMSSSMGRQVNMVHNFVENRPEYISVAQAAKRAIKAASRGERSVRYYGKKLADHRNEPAFQPVHGPLSAGVHDGIKHFAASRLPPDFDASHLTGSRHADSPPSAVGPSRQNQFHAPEDSELAQVMARTGGSIGAQAAESTPMRSDIQRFQGHHASTVPSSPHMAETSSNTSCRSADRSPRHYDENAVGLGLRVDTANRFISTETAVTPVTINDRSAGVRQPSPRGDASFSYHSEASPQSVSPSSSQSSRPSSPELDGGASARAFSERYAEQIRKLAGTELGDALASVKLAGRRSSGENSSRSSSDNESNTPSRRGRKR
jgi:hypothetical protein